MGKISLSLEKAPVDSVIWKYLDLPSFFSLLLNQKLVFRRFDKFADKLEGTMPESSQRDFQAFLENELSSEEAIQRVITEKECINRYKFWTYANSWSINKEENYALWKIYLSDSESGVAIKSTINGLKNSIIYDSTQIKNDEDLCIREVKYEPLSYANTNQNTVFTHKYSYYRYESELRLFFKNQRNFKNKDEDISEGYNDDEVKLIGVNLLSLIDEVYISPFADKWCIDTIQDLVNTRFSEFNIKFGKSRILV